MHERMTRNFQALSVLFIVAAFLLITYPGNVHAGDKTRSTRFQKKGIQAGKKGDHEKAIDYFTKSIEAHTGNFSAYRQRAFSYHKIDKDDLAFQDIESALTIKPDYVTAHLAKAAIHRDREEFDQALQVYDKVLEIDDLNVSVFNGRGILYQETEEFQKAIIAFEKVIELAPKSSMGHNNLGYTYLLMGDYEKAEKYTRKALKIDKNMSAALIGMAELYSMLNEKEEACKWLKKGVKKRFNVDGIRELKTLDNIRNEECYKKLVPDG